MEFVTHLYVEFLTHSYVEFVSNMEIWMSKGALCFVPSACGVRESFIRGICDLFICAVRESYRNTEIRRRASLCARVRDSFTYGVHESITCGVCDSFIRGVRGSYRNMAVGRLLWCGVMCVCTCK